MPVIQKQCRSKKRKVLRSQGTVVFYANLTHCLGIYWPCIYNTENESNVDSNIQSKECNIDDTISEVSRIREYDPTIDERLPETVTLLTTPDGGKLYLVGTAHFSVESQNDVSKVIIYAFFFVLILDF